MSNNLCFVTGNSNKLREVSQILKRNLESKAIDLVEVQGSSKEIATAKVLEAVSHTKTATITEDTSLYFNALGELPGPYVKYFLEMGTERMVKILDSFEDKTGYALCTVAYSTPDGKVTVFEGRTDGKIVDPRDTIGPDGTMQKSFGWDPIFMPDGFDRTYSQMSKAEKNLISHRGKAFRQLEEYLDSLDK